MRVKTVSRSRVELTATDFAERLEFSYRACQFIGSLIQFFEQADVLDSDHGLIGKGFKELDLRRGEGTHFGATCDQCSN